MNLILRLIVGALATAAAVWLVPGIRIVAEDKQHYVMILLIVAAIMGVVNAIIKPLTQAISFCLIVITLGLFLIVINAAMLALTAWVAQNFDIGFYVDGFWPAVFGSLVISVVSSIAGGLLGTEK